MTLKKNLLFDLIESGHIIAIENGKLVIQPSRFNQLGIDINSSKALLVSEIASVIGIPIFTFKYHTTGSFGVKRAFDGVTLHFTKLNDFSECYAIFNAELKRSRNSNKHKKGTRYPRGQFALKKHSKLVSTWLKLRLKPPTSLTRYHQHFGQLKSVFITGITDLNNKLSNDSIELVNISFNELQGIYHKHSYSAHSEHIIHSQNEHSVHTILSHNETNDGLMDKGFKNNLGTCSDGCVIKNQVIKNDDSRLKVMGTNNTEVEEWLSSYDPNNELDTFAG